MSKYINPTDKSNITSYPTLQIDTDQEKAKAFPTPTVAVQTVHGFGFGSVGKQVRAKT